ncbi:MAG: sulfatase, partial [Candidatus Sumerlaeota bacterium]|nr:sulfatase [Candidatus Sumerlaeota bacterium]
TPHIDRLAQEGAVFLDNISPAIWTLPSVASMMTGLHVHSDGAGARNDHFRCEAPTIADVLSALGYRTAAFFGNHFAQMSGKGFRETHMPVGDANRIGPDCHQVSRARVHDAMHWIERSALSDRTPFFLYIQIMDPHLPLHPVSPFKEQFTLPYVSDDEMTAYDFNPAKIFRRELQLPPRAYEVLAHMYDAETASADSHVGVLADFMRRKGALDRTIFIVMSDHGDMRGEHRNKSLHDHFAHHLCAYEELIKTPLVVRWPAGIPAGTRVNGPTQTHDIFPTLAKIIGFAAPHCQGFDLLATAAGRPERAFTLTEYQKSIHHASRILSIDPDIDPRLYLRRLKAWRQGGMKYIWASDGEDELYDLNKDPREMNNLIAAQPDAAQRMRLEMEDYIMTLPCARVPDEINSPKITPVAVERLRAMEWFLD